MPLFIIAQLTIREAQRRKILWVALIMGALFVGLFGLGLHYIVREMELYSSGGLDLNNEFTIAPINGLTMAGLYVTNFLVVIMSVLISVASIPSEIESRLIDTIIVKPMRRWQLVVGKWIGFTVMSVTYCWLLAGGILLVSYLRTGYTFNNYVSGISLLCLNAVIMMTVTIAGGTRFSTLANGVMAFMLYGLAFVGGWVETVGSLFRNDAAVNIGIISSLLVPIEAVWRKAVVQLQPLQLIDTNFAGPFVVTSEPSDVMMGYALFYVVAVLAFAAWSFGRRDL